MKVVYATIMVLPEAPVVSEGKLVAGAQHRALVKRGAYHVHTPDGWIVVFPSEVKVIGSVAERTKAPLC